MKLQEAVSYVTLLFTVASVGTYCLAKLYFRIADSSTERELAKYSSV